MVKNAEMSKKPVFGKTGLSASGRCRRTRPPNHGPAGPHQMAPVPSKSNRKSPQACFESTQSGGTVPATVRPHRPKPLGTPIFRVHRARPHPPDPTPRSIKKKLPSLNHWGHEAAEPTKMKPWVCRIQEK